MLKFRLKRIEIRIDFSFFAVLAMVLLVDKSGCAVLSLIASVCHETGHLLVLIIEKNFPGYITFYGGGIKISKCKNKASFAVLLAGSLSNFLLGFIFLAASDGTSIFPLLFACANLLIGVFNLLPLPNLDGGQLVAMAAERLLKPKGAYTSLLFAQAVGMGTIIGFIIIAICCNVFNTSFFLVLIYIFLLDILVKM